MAEPIEELKKQLKSLEEENRQLRDSCEQLQVIQGSMERIIGDSNAKSLRAEMSSMELEQVFSACTDALWVVREDGVVVRANPSILELLGRPVSEVVGRQCRDILHYHRCEGDTCPLLAGKDEKLEYDIQLSTTSVENGDFILSTAPLITLDGSKGIVVQFKDITSRKRAEHELAAANVVLEQMARTDGLTQIANRRCLDEVMEKEWRWLAREREPLSLLMGDIDFFKKFNDHYGHQAGDDCLRRVGKALDEAMLRPADLAARYGGEEFALLLPRTALDGAFAVGRRVLAAIGELEIEHQESAVSDFVSISLGVATLIPCVAQTPQGLIAMADKALYQAKALGRNRIASVPE